MPKVLFIKFYTESKLLLNNYFKVTSRFAFSNEFDIDAEEIKKYDIVVLGGGKSGRNPRADSIFKYVKNLKKLKNLKHVKILGICYGSQVLCKLYGKRQKTLLSRHKKRIETSMNTRKIRFNHRYYCADKKPLETYTIRKPRQKPVKIPTFLKYSKNHYGIQYHYINKKDRSALIKNIIAGKI